MTDTTESACVGIQERLSAYLDSRLPADELTTIRTHLANCGPCQAERRALERTDALVAAAVSDHPFGDAFVEDLLGTLPTQTLRHTQLAPPVTLRPRRAMPSGIGLAALAAGLLLALGLNLTNTPQTINSVEPPAVVAKAGPGLMLLGRDGGAELSANAEISVGDRILAIASPASLTLEDGTQVELHADSEVTLRADADGGLTIAFAPGTEGKIYCEVNTRQAPFRVSANGLDVQVLGTKFLVEQRHASSTITVVEGRVLATSRADRRTLTANDQAEATPGSGPGRLAFAKVTARRHGLWVPRLATQQAKIDEAAAKVAPTNAPIEPKLTTKPTEPPVNDSGMDQPMQPPEFNGGK